MKKKSTSPKPKQDELDYTQVQAALNELNRRMPDLFKGEVCPHVMSEKSCNCTFESGCKALKNQQLTK